MVLSNNLSTRIVNKQPLLIYSIILEKHVALASYEEIWVSLEEY